MSHQAMSSLHPISAAPSPRSALGLNAANFFLAELLGVVVPVLSTFLLRDCGWRYDSVGVAVALGGLGVFLMQTPAGFLVDRIRQRRALLAAASLAVGLCYGLLPLVPPQPFFVDSLLTLGGMAQAFFAPLLGALALGLVGHAALSKTVGINQGYNHAGNLFSALLGMVLVRFLGLSAIFYAVAIVSLLAAAAVFLIRRDELDEERASGRESKQQGKPAGFWQLMRDRRIAILFAATALFHLANAPTMPLVSEYVDHLGGSRELVVAVVLVAQAVMIPVALLSGRLCERWGRKPVFAIGFLVLPLRIVLYSLTRDPRLLVALQALDGIGAGIYGVVIVAMCADLTRGTGRFNALQGLIATALSLGGVIGPVCSGLLVQHLGFSAAFTTFAAIAGLAAALFILFMPETRPTSQTTVSPRETSLPRPGRSAVPASSTL